MRIFDPHIHMYARTTDDYEAMALAGIEAVVDPSSYPATMKAVEAFQTSHGISAVGQVGPLTRAELNSLCTSSSTS